MTHYNVKFFVLKNNINEFFFLTKGPLGFVKIKLINLKTARLIFNQSFFTKDWSNWSILELDYIRFKFWLKNLIIKPSDLIILKNIIKKSILAVCFGNFSYLNLVGIGYKAKIEGDKLFLNLGLSHSFIISKPLNIYITIPDGNKQQKITIFGINLDSVIKLSSKIRNLSKPEIYKGKGIRFENEIIFLKEKKKKN